MKSHRIHALRGNCRSLARQQAHRLPQPSNIIASSFTSPIDSLYLAAIFDPIFTASYPGVRQVRRISLLAAIIRAFLVPEERPPVGAKMVDLRTLLEANPGRVIVVYPEVTTTNGRGILEFSPSLTSAPTWAKIFPISLRYTPGDITTPIPGTYWTFLWNLLSRPTHCIRVRIAECVYVAPKATVQSSYLDKSYTSNFLDTLQAEDATASSSTDTLASADDARSSNGLTLEDKRILDRVADSLARLSRVKRVALGAKEKTSFVQSWNRQHKT